MYKTQKKQQQNHFKNTIFNFFPPFFSLSCSSLWNQRIKWKFFSCHLHLCRLMCNFYVFFFFVWWNFFLLFVILIFAFECSSSKKMKICEKQTWEKKVVYVCESSSFIFPRVIVIFVEFPLKNQNEKLW